MAMSSKVFVNCEVGLDGDGEATILKIKNITPKPIYKVYGIDNLPACDMEYGKSIDVSIKSVYFIK